MKVSQPAARHKREAGETETAARKCPCPLGPSIRGFLRPSVMLLLLFKNRFLMACVEWSCVSVPYNRNI